jgi:hypothetical protein
MTRQHYSEFNVGDRIRASDGTKAPPKHHNRKLAKWKDRNFTGSVHEIGEPWEHEPNGSLTLKRDDYPDSSYIKFNFHHTLGGRVQFEKIEEAEAA